MATKKRKTISKGTRFEIFKRDGFKCQYCGAHPPEAILHVDHIKPVADGGGNESENLITSCSACNLGKSDKSLSDIPPSLKQMAEETAEREEQILGYQAIMESKRNRIEEEMWRVAYALDPRTLESGMRRDWLESIKMFIGRLGLYPVLEAAEIAHAYSPYGGKKEFLYFCGICWNRVREVEAQHA